MHANRSLKVVLVVVMLVWLTAASAMATNLKVCVLGAVANQYSQIRIRVVCSGWGDQSRYMGSSQKVWCNLSHPNSNLYQGPQQTCQATFYNLPYWRTAWIQISGLMGGRWVEVNHWWYDTRASSSIHTWCSDELW